MGDTLLLCSSYHEAQMQRDWQEYADACLTHDTDEPVVVQASSLAHDMQGMDGFDSLIKPHAA